MGGGKLKLSYQRQKYAQYAARAYDGKKVHGSEKLHEHSNSTAKTYRHQNGEIVIAYRGTDPTKANDLKADLAIARGQQSSNARFQEAMGIYNNVKAANPNAKISLTGHSLGGALAQHVASQTQGSHAYTFNAGAGPAQLLGGRHSTNWTTGDDLISKSSEYQKSGSHHIHTPKGDDRSKLGFVEKHGMENFLSEKHGGRNEHLDPCSEPNPPSWCENEQKVRKGAGQTTTQELKAQQAGAQQAGAQHVQYPHVSGEIGETGDVPDVPLGILSLFDGDGAAAAEWLGALGLPVPLRGPSLQLIAALKEFWRIRNNEGTWTNEEVRESWERVYDAAEEEGFEMTNMPARDSPPGYNRVSTEEPAETSPGDILEGYGDDPEGGMEVPEPGPVTEPPALGEDPTEGNPLEEPLPGGDGGEAPIPERPANPFDPPEEGGFADPSAPPRLPETQPGTGSRGTHYSTLHQHAQEAADAAGRPAPWDPALGPRPPNAPSEPPPAGGQYGEDDPLLPEEPPASGGEAPGSGGTRYSDVDEIPNELIEIYGVELGHIRNRNFARQYLAEHPDATMDEVILAFENSDAATLEEYLETGTHATGNRTAEQYRNQWENDFNTARESVAEGGGTSMMWAEEPDPDILEWANSYTGEIPGAEAAEAAEGASFLTGFKSADIAEFASLRTLGHAAGVAGVAYAAAQGLGYDSPALDRKLQTMMNLQIIGAKVGAAATGLAGLATGVLSGTSTVLGALGAEESAALAAVWAGTAMGATRYGAATLAGAGEGLLIWGTAGYLAYEGSSEIYHLATYKAPHYDDDPIEQKFVEGVRGAWNTTRGKDFDEKWQNKANTTWDPVLGGFFGAQGVDYMQDRGVHLKEGIMKAYDKAMLAQFEELGIPAQFWDDHNNHASDYNIHVHGYSGKGYHGVNVNDEEMELMYKELVMQSRTMATQFNQAKAMHGMQLGATQQGLSNEDWYSQNSDWYESWMQDTTYDKESGYVGGGAMNFKFHDLPRATVDEDGNIEWSEGSAVEPTIKVEYLDMPNVDLPDHDLSLSQFYYYNAEQTFSESSKSLEDWTAWDTAQVAYAKYLHYTHDAWQKAGTSTYVDADSDDFRNHDDDYWQFWNVDLNSDQSCLRAYGDSWDDIGQSPDAYFKLMQAAHGYTNEQMGYIQGMFIDSGEADPQAWTKNVFLPQVIQYEHDTDAHMADEDQDGDEQVEADEDKDDDGLLAANEPGVEEAKTGARGTKRKVVTDDGLWSGRLQDQHKQSKLGMGDFSSDDLIEFVNTTGNFTWEPSYYVPHSKIGGQAIPKKIGPPIGTQRSHGGQGSSHPIGEQITRKDLMIQTIHSMILQHPKFQTMRGML